MTSKLVVISGFCATLLVLGCSADTPSGDASESDSESMAGDDGAGPASILGTWHGVEIEAPLFIAYYELWELTFAEDGTATETSLYDGDVIAGSYEVDGSTVTIDWGNDGENLRMGELSADELIIEFETTGYDQTGVVRTTHLRGPAPDDAAVASGTSCNETGVFCADGNVVDCLGGESLRDCDGCPYVGPGTGSEYDSSCKSSYALCPTCQDGSTTWSGPGCYYGSSIVCGSGVGGGECTTDAQCGECSRCSDGACRFCGYGPAGLCTC